MIVGIDWMGGSPSSSFEIGDVGLIIGDIGDIGDSSRGFD
jgi:hypothetical protein